MTPESYHINKQKGTIETDDCVSLHWESVGEGPAIVCCNGVGVSTFFWKYIIRDFSNTHRIITWDYRAHGLSQRDLTDKQKDFSIVRHTEDLKTILEHIIPGESVMLVGHSMGCQVSLEFKLQFPKLVRGIALLLGTAGRALETFGDNPMSPYIFRAVRRVTNKIGPRVNFFTRALLLSQIAWPFTKRFQLVDPLYTSRDDFQPYLDHIASMDMLVFTDAVWACHEHDAWNNLDQITVPVLVVAAERDTFTPIHCAESIVEALPNAEFMVLADGSHAALIEQPDNISHRLERFIEEHDLHDVQLLK